ncbi:ABC transporter substrate-binding protein [Pusillimonas noertemannii]|uniref:ABC transporter substrate-binding protein n=1 Tax=Pusillimonas noertemannii TaxID=305977 RepID=UPI00333F3903
MTSIQNRKRGGMLIRSAFATLAGAALIAASGAAHALEKVTVRLDFSPLGFHTAMYLAKEKGWFEREGLDVTIQDGSGSLNTIQLVAAGQADIGQVQLGLLVAARDKGLPLKSFAGYLRGSDLAVMVPRDSNINTLADLKGKKILCFTASPWAPFIDSFLAKGGLDRKSVDITMVAPSAMAGLYSSGDADGFMSVAPHQVPLLEKARPAKTIRMADYGIHFPSYGLIATEKTLKERREMLEKFNKVQIEAWEYIWNGHEDEAVQAMIKQRPGVNLDPVSLKGQLDMNRPLFFTEATKDKRIGWQSEADWTAALQSMKEAGIDVGSVKLEDLYTNDLMPADKGES